MRAYCQSMSSRTFLKTIIALGLFGFPVAIVSGPIFNRAVSLVLMCVLLVSILAVSFVGYRGPKDD